MWWAWRIKIKNRTRWPGQINMARCLLYEYGKLPETTRRALAAREKKPKNRLYVSYTPSEFRRIYAASWTLVRSARRRIKANLADLETYNKGEELPDAPHLYISGEKWSRGKLLDHIYRTGHFPGGSVPRYQIQQFRELLRVSNVKHTPLALFASTAEVLAGAVLLVCERGFNISVVDGLTAYPLNADGEPGEVTIHQLDKPRRGPDDRFFSASFAGKAGRIWRVLAEITQPARDHLADIGSPTNKLLVGRALGGRRTGDTFKTDWTECWTVAPSWQKACKLLLDTGDPLRLDFRRLRLTEQIVNRRSSQNSDRVSESIYRAPDWQTKELAREVTVQGQRDALADAQAIVAVRGIGTEEYGHALENPAELAAVLHVSESRVRQLLNGEMDTVATACIAITKSPFSEHGEACKASFLRCFGCKNAIATPSHLPRLVLLFDAISDLATVVSDAVWNADYREAHQQLSSLLSNYSTEPERALARASATEDDREAIAQLLDRRYDA